AATSTWTASRIRWCAPKAASLRWWAWKTWSWSRPRTRCWSPARARCSASSRWSNTWRPRSAPSTCTTPASIVHGATTRASMRATVSRSSASP
ncbi:hypothetical protein LTR94_036554, partial [Friedmanniomyces endolithicus]